MVNRLLAYFVTLFLALTLNFFLPRAMPGDPMALVAGNSVRQMGAEHIAELRESLGLDRPIGEQYIRYLGQLIRGDLGQSYRYSGGLSVVKVLADRFLWTFMLVLVSLTIATIIGTLLGTWAAWRHGTWRDVGLLSGLFALRSIPAFWLAMILIPVFAVQWRLLPVGDSYSFPRPEGFRRVTDVAYHAILPITVLTLAYIPTPFAIMRSSMLGVVGADYIRTARAKGLSERAVLLNHAARNALLPLVTIVALDFGQLLGGVLIIETVFNYRGLGSMMFEAVKSRDYPLLQGGFLLFTFGVLTVNLLVDLLYTRLDPRVRRGNE
ncbi:MAG TPA: ABC transporter permease [candidate division Zixibacteria bacterium]|nr:ABC transporter permease [candidate division Zixibacteria bacterium]